MIAATPLDRLLATLDVRLHAFAVCRVERGWRLTFEPMPAVVIHYVLAGTGVIVVDGGEALPLQAGDMVVVPPGSAESLSVDLDATREISAKDRCLMLGDGLMEFRAFEASPDLVTVCGTITATYGGAFGLFDHLVGPLLAPTDNDPVMRRAFALLVEELDRPGIGTLALTEALMKQCLVLLLRRELVRDGNSPLFRVVAGPRLFRAVTRVLEQPGADHPLEALAASAGMSRSVFAESFVALYGETPSAFVLKVRLRRAAQLLSATNLPIKVVAQSVGYASRSYFGRAFRASYGVDPRTYRGLNTPTEEQTMSTVADR